MTGEPDRGPSTVRLALLAASVAAAAAAVRLWTLHEMDAANPLFRVTVLDEAVYLRQAAQFRSGQGFAPSLVSLFWPWLLALVGAVDHGVAALVNVAIGSTTAMLAAVGAAKLARSVAAGAAAGGLIALSGAMIFQDVTAQIEPLLALSVLVAALALAAAARSPTPLRLAVAGAAVGVATLGRGTNLALLLGAVPAVRAAGPGNRWVRAAVVFVAALAPVALFDRAVGALPTSGGVNVWLGNNEWSRATLSFGTDEFLMDPESEAAAVSQLAAASEGRALTPSEINAWWSARAWRETTAEPGATLLHLAKKTLLVLYPDDMGGNHDAVLEREFAAPLRLLPVTFAWILVLGAAGYVVARRSAPGIDAAALAAAGFVAAAIVVFPLTRYVAPLVPVAAVLAGAGAAQCLRPDRDRRTSVVAGATLAVLACASFAAGLLRPANRAEALMNLGVASMETGLGDPDVYFRRSAAEDASYAPPLVMLGARAFDAGKFEDALGRFDAAVEIAWGNAKFVGSVRDALLGRCRALASLGRLADALETADRAAEAFQLEAEFPAEGAMIALAMRDRDGAARRLAAAKARDPSNERVRAAEQALSRR